MMTTKMIHLKHLQEGICKPWKRLVKEWSSHFLSAPRHMSSSGSPQGRHSVGKESSCWCQPRDNTVWPWGWHCCSLLLLACQCQVNASHKWVNLKLRLLASWKKFSLENPLRPRRSMGFFCVWGKCDVSIHVQVNSKCCFLPQFARDAGVLNGAAPS